VDKTPKSMDDIENAKIVLIGGPIGVGKTTVIDQLVASTSQIVRPSAYTTRLKRNDDRSSQFIYLSVSEFKKMESAGEFLRVDNVLGNYYGMSKQHVTELMKANCMLAKEIHARDHQAFKEIFPQAISIIILPKCWKKYRKRMCQTHSLNDLRRASVLNEVSYHQETILIGNATYDAILYNDFAQDSKMLSEMIVKIFLQDKPSKV
jgi:guanylate kinase